MGFSMTMTWTMTTEEFRLQVHNGGPMAGALVGICHLHSLQPACHSLSFKRRDATMMVPNLVSPNALTSCPLIIPLLACSSSPNHLRSTNPLITNVDSAIHWAPTKLSPFLDLLHARWCLRANISPLPADDAAPDFKDLEVRTSNI